MAAPANLNDSFGATHRSQKGRKWASRAGLERRELPSLAATFAITAVSHLTERAGASPVPLSWLTGRDSAH